MKKTFTKKRGISTTLVVIITIAASIALAVGVALFAASVFQGGALQESISITKAQLWVQDPVSNNLAWGAFVARNNGDTILSINKIIVRGTEIPFKNWYVDTDVSHELTQQPMNFTGWSGINGKLNNSTGVICDPNVQVQISLQLNANPPSSGWFCGVQLSGPLGIGQDQSAILYYQIPNGTISAVDGGNSVRLSVFAGKTGSTQSIFVESKK